MPSAGLEIFVFLSSVHMKIEEKISLTCGRDGGLQNMELHGMIMLHISDEKFARIRLHVENEDKRGVQLQVKCLVFMLSNMLLLFSGAKYWKYLCASVLCTCLSLFSKYVENGSSHNRHFCSINAGLAYGQKFEVHLRSGLIRLSSCLQSLIYPVKHVGMPSDFTWTLQQPGVAWCLLHDVSCSRWTGVL